MSSNGNIIRVTGPLCGEFTGHRWSSCTKAVMWSFDVFFDLRLNKHFSKQSWGWRFEMPSRSLWRCCNEIWNFDFCRSSTTTLSQVEHKCISILGDKLNTRTSHEKIPSSTWSWVVIIITPTPHNSWHCSTFFGPVFIWVPRCPYLFSLTHGPFYHAETPKWSRQ